MNRRSSNRASAPERAPECAGTRRRLLIALGACAVAAPVASLAQPARRVRRIGFLALRRPVVLESDQFGAFPRGLRELGYVEGRDFVIEWRFADGKSERLPALAAELVALNVDVILAAGTQAIGAARKATASIPIVMAGANDPVGTGFVASLARPGGNVTGLSLLLDDIAPKQLELLVAVVPKLARVALLANPANVSAPTLRANVEAAARNVGIVVVAVEARTATDIGAAFATMVRERAGAVIVASDALFTQQADEIATLAERARLPSMAPFREYVEAGALMSYGENFTDHFRRTADYVHRIFQGSKPAELPVAQPTKFELAINLRTARALGVTVPSELLLRADLAIP